MAFDKDKPAASTSLRSSNPEILANWSQLQTAVNNEHIFSGTASATQTGDHTQGSARVFFQDSSPTTRIDGSGFLSTDLGSLWVDTNSSPDNQFNILTATVPTWTPVSTEVIATLLAAARVFASTLGVTGDFAVNTNKFNVTAASGNATAAGTLEATGLTTVADGSITKTSAAPSTDAMIANKKYVDDQVTGITDPAYSGGESHTLVGGLIIKMGFVSDAGALTTVTFGTPFPAALISVNASTRDNTTRTSEPVINNSASKTSFVIESNEAVSGYYWIAIGH